MAFARFVDLLDSWQKGAAHFANLGVEYVVAVPVRLLLFLPAMQTRNERFHAAVAVSALVYLLSWALRQFETLG
jgi:hypothetical protein